MEIALAQAEKDECMEGGYIGERISTCDETTHMDGVQSTEHKLTEHLRSFSGVSSEKCVHLQIIQDKQFDLGECQRWMLRLFLNCRWSAEIKSDQ